MTQDDILRAIDVTLHAWFLAHPNVTAGDMQEAVFQWALDTVARAHNQNKDLRKRHTRCGRHAE